MSRLMVAALALSGVTTGLVLMTAQSTPVRSSGTTARGLATPGIADVPGIKVGHHTLTERPTGCTVVLVDGPGAVGGVSQRGGAPGTRETDLLDPANMVERVNAIALAGGSAFGLDAAQGVVRFLDERKIGYHVGAAGVVPIVPAAILMDLWFGGDPKVRPTADCGYRAAFTASTGPVAEGNVGAGAGATVGKMRGMTLSMKGGMGTASLTMPNGLIVGALAAVNAVGDIIDPTSSRVVAGARTDDGKSLADVRTLLRSGMLSRPTGLRAGGNTTIAVVATNARLTKAEASRMAIMADDGLARAINPSHTVGDGDTVFALATGQLSGQVDVSVVGALSAEVLAEAIVRAVVKAESLAGVPSARELHTTPARFK